MRCHHRVEPNRGKENDRGRQQLDRLRQTSSSGLEVGSGNLCALGGIACCLPPGHPVLISSTSHRFFGRDENFLRGFEVREPLRQQDCSLIKCITRDGPDYGFLKILKPVGGVGFHGGRYPTVLIRLFKIH